MVIAATFCGNVFSKCSLSLRFGSIARHVVWPQSLGFDFSAAAPIEPLPNGMKEEVKKVWRLTACFKNPDKVIFNELQVEKCESKHHYNGNESGSTDNNAAKPWLAFFEKEKEIFSSE